MFYCLVVASHRSDVSFVHFSEAELRHVQVMVYSPGLFPLQFLAFSFFTIALTLTSNFKRSVKTFFLFLIFTKQADRIVFVVKAGLHGFDLPVWCGTELV